MKYGYPSLSEYYKIESTLDLEPQFRKIKAFFDLVSIPLKSRNSRLIGHFVTRSTALTSFSWIIDNDPKNEVYNRVKNSIQKLINQHAYAVFFGISAYKISTSYKQNLGIVVDISKIDNSTFDLDDNIFHIYENGSLKKSIDINEANILVDKVDYLAKGGLMRSIFPLEILRIDILLEYANFLRKLKGILQIIDKGSSPESQSVAELAARSAINHNYLITDDLIEFKLNSITNANGNSFKDFLDIINKEISIAILGQANVAELPHYGGSRAALQVLKMISADIMYSDMARVENLINNYLLIDYNFNYGNGTPDYKFKFLLAEEQDIEKNASALRIANEFLDLKKSEAYEKIGLTPPAPDDEIIPSKKTLRGFEV